MPRQGKKEEAILLQIELAKTSLLCYMRAVQQTALVWLY